MKKQIFAVLSTVVVTACGQGEEAGDMPEIGTTTQASIRAACTAPSACPPNENCTYVALGDDGYGYCIVPITGRRELCSPSQPYCCADVWCWQAKDKRYRIVGVQSGCNDGKTCQLCPSGKVRKASPLQADQCCTPVVSCAGRCGTVADSCGWPASCGGCPSGQSCVNNQCRSSGGDCPRGQTRCSGRCVYTSIDENNCGRCGRRCGRGQVCDAGRCVGGGGPLPN